MFVVYISLDAEVRCLLKINDTRGVAEGGVSSVARVLPTCSKGFNFMQIPSFSI